jgi:hypothetical protein
MFGVGSRESFGMDFCVEFSGVHCGVHVALSDSLCSPTRTPCEVFRFSCACGTQVAFDDVSVDPASPGTPVPIDATSAICGDAELQIISTRRT